MDKIFNEKFQKYNAKESEEIEQIRNHYDAKTKELYAARIQERNNILDEDEN